MFQNYLIVALRNLRKNRLQSIIKIAGLALGISTCMVMYVIISYELSFDTHLPGRERIYRVYTVYSGVFEGYNSGVPYALPTAVEEEFTGLEAVVHFLTYSTKVKVTDGGAKTFDQQDNVIITSPGYFKTFPIHSWIAGRAEDLSKPFTVAITESKARLYFGTTDVNQVMGKEIIYSDSLSVSVVGIVTDIKENTDLHFTDFISISTVPKSWLKNSYDLMDWGSTSSSSKFFVRLSEGTDQSKIESQLPSLQKHLEKPGEQKKWNVDYKLQPMSDLHFDTKMGIFDNYRPAAHLPTLKSLVIVSLLLLIIAAINFINLETAEAIRRSKEVGIRKVMGSSRMSLVTHFLGDSILLTSISVVLSIPLSVGAMVYFKEFLPKGISFPFEDPLTYVFLMTTLVVVGVLSGLYPAVVLSSFQPAMALKSQVMGMGQSNSAMLRKGLTVFQFTMSQILIVGTIVVAWQIDFMMNKDLGFTKDAIVTFSTPRGGPQSRLQTLKNEIERIPDVSAVCLQWSAPMISGTTTTIINYKTQDHEQSDVVHGKMGDSTFVSFYNIKLLAGRNIQASDSAMEFLINETYLRKLGFSNPQDAIGIPLNRSKKDYTVVGVVADFHMQSLHHAIEPMIFRYDSKASGFAVKLSSMGKKGGEMQPILDQISKEFNKVYPDRKVSITFLDEDLMKLYETEKRTAKLAILATSIAIFISCLGLFGLASFTAIQRTKEIGIRKVLGASVNSIVVLLSREFMVLVVVAFLLAAPLAYFGAGVWLKEFAYKQDLSVWVFIFTAFLSVMIAFLTISYRAIKAGVANPIDSLRYE